MTEKETDVSVRSSDQWFQRHRLVLITVLGLSWIITILLALSYFKQHQKAKSLLPEDQFFYNLWSLQSKDMIQMKVKEIVLVPLGKVEPSILTDVKAWLESKILVTVTIYNNLIPIGKPDRYVATEEEKAPQYNAHRIIHLLYEQFPVQKSDAKGFLAITGNDIYSSDLNFLFGYAIKPYAVMSYFRFMSLYHGQYVTSPKFKERVIKQAASSAFFILGIPRCGTEGCIRQYPNSVEEQDQKGNTLCNWCREQLKAYYQK